MKRSKPKTYKRWKAVGIALAAVAVGIGLLVLSRVIVPVPAEPAVAASTTHPAPADPPPPSKTPDTAASANNMSGLLLLFSMMSFGIAAIGIGWLVFDIHRSRPAWKTQTKYPSKR